MCGEVHSQISAIGLSTRKTDHEEEDTKKFKEYERPQSSQEMLDRPITALVLSTKGERSAFMFLRDNALRLSLCCAHK